MSIDWFTVVAQVFNFLILMWLLKHFLYQPILNAIDAREKLIATELDNADQKSAEAQQEKDEFKQKNKEIAEQRASLVSKATEEVAVFRQQLLDEARQAAEALRMKRQEALRSEERELHNDIRRQTQMEVFAIARKVLADLATTDLEERLGKIFISRLREMDGPTKAGFAEIIKTTADSLLVRSAFELPTEQRDAIQKALNETFSAEVRVRFETAPDLIGGVELVTHGQKVAWSIADYLSSLEIGIEELLGDKSKSAAKPAAEATDKPEKSASVAETP